MSQFKFLQIDEEGYPLSGGLRFQDKEFGKILLQNIQKAPNRRIFTTKYEGETYILENFDEPLIAQHVHFKNDKWYIEFPYDLYLELHLESLKVDEWDRFHGRTSEDVPFLFSRKAQADFFNLVSEFDDEGFTIGTRYYKLPNLHEKQSFAEQKDFWDETYKTQNTGWDLEGPHPALESIVSQLRINKCRILNLGCGKGHDANFFAQRGHIVTGIDFSEEAITHAQNLYGEKDNLRFLKHDAFQLPEKFFNSFDLIFEHTFFCAISPHRRNDLIKVWKNCLVPGGHFLGFLYTLDNETSPPFGATEWEYRERLKKYFQFLYWTRLRGSSPRSLGSELIIYAQKL